MTTTTGRVSLWALLGALLVPLIVAGGFLSATWGADDRLHRVRAAIVNNDQPVTIDDQLVPLGRQLSGGLVRGQDDIDNLTWVLTDADRAEDGLRDGTYSAVVTIPKDFSAAATSTAGKPADARQATIDIVTSPDSGIADPLIAGAVAQVATDTLNRTLTETSLDAIFVGLNQAGDGMRQAADGAGQLADGAGQLAAGTDQAASGIWRLSDGLTQLTDGGGQLRTGGGQLSSGAHQLAAGTSQLAAGTAALPGQAGLLADGSAQFASGVQQYTSGVSQLNSGLGSLSGGLNQLDQQVSAGGSTNLGDVDQLITGTQGLSTGADELATGTKELSTGIDQLATGTKDLNSGLTDYEAGLQQTARTGLIDPETKTPVCPAKVAAMGPSYCAVFTEGTKAGAGAAAAGLNRAGPNQEPSLLDASDTLASNADLTAAGAQQVSGSAAELADGAQQLNTGVAGLATALAPFSTQQASLAATIHQLAIGSAQLAEGSAALDAGGPQLNAGAQQLADGNRQLAAGMVALSQGAGQLNVGAQVFAQGVTQYTAGVAQYTDGVNAAAAGTRELASGMDELGSGTRQLADGSRELADGLADGAGQAPQYTPAERDQLANAMTRPVTADGTDLQGTLISGPAMLLVLSLWLGGLATFVALRSVASRALTDNLAETRSSWRLAARTILPGALIGVGQAAAITAIGQAHLDLPAGQASAALGVMVLAGITFAVLNQALVAWLGGAGRVIAVALAVLSAADALVGATPPIFDAVHAFLPMTPAIDALRATVTGEPGVGPAVLTLACWLFAASAAVLLRVVRSRTLTAERLVAEFA